MTLLAVLEMSLSPLDHESDDLKCTSIGLGPLTARLTTASHVGMCYACLVRFYAFAA
jgi:hypothetical protein